MNSPHAHLHHHSSSSVPGSDSSSIHSTGNKYAPARRLAARQTLRLAIPKYQCDSTFGSSVNGNTNGGGLSVHNNAGHRYQPHVSPPNPSATQHYYRPNGIHHGKVPSAPIITMNGLNTTSPIRESGLTSTCTSMNGKFLGVRKPSITLSSADATNNNEMFAFAKDCSPVDHLSEHSPIFAELASSISPSTSSSSPTFNRLFSLSPSSMRSYALDNVSPV